MRRKSKRSQAALHEAGHCVMAWQRRCTFTYAEIMSDGEEGHMYELTHCYDEGKHRQILGAGVVAEYYPYEVPEDAAWSSTDQDKLMDSFLAEMPDVIKEPAVIAYCGILSVFDDIREWFGEIPGLWEAVVEVASVLDDCQVVSYNEVDKICKRCCNL